MSDKIDFMFELNQHIYVVDRNNIEEKIIRRRIFTQSFPNDNKDAESEESIHYRCNTGYDFYQSHIGGKNGKCLVFADKNEAKKYIVNKVMEM